MLTPLEILRMLAPEFADIDDVDVLRFLALAEEETPASQCKRAHAVALLAAHYMALANMGTGAGGVGVSGSATTVREGDLSVTFATGAQIGVTGGLGATRFGVELDRLRRECVITPMTIMVRR